MRREESNEARAANEYELIDRRPRGRPKKRWMDIGWNATRSRDYD